MNSFANRAQPHCQLLFVIGVALFAAMLLGAGNARGAELSANVDRAVISENETLHLTLKLNEQVGYGGPDFSPLEKDFKIISRRRSNQFRNINGRTEGWTDWTVELAPRKTGKLSIPPLNFQGAVSSRVDITVTEASQPTSGEVQDIFVEVETDKPDVFVQEQLLLTVKIHTGILLRDVSMNEQLKIDNAVVESIRETAYNKQLNGRLYRVMELAYAIYPQRSGPLHIPSLSWNLVMATDRGSGLRYRFQTPGQLRRVRSEPVTIEVKPQAPHYTGDHWLPASEVKLEQHWSSDPSRFVVGEPITRTITLTAEGVTSSQLPPLPDQIIDGIKVYSDQPQLDDLVTPTGVIGHRIESVAIVPTKAGTLTLPETRVSWWDTTAQRQRVATIPAQTLTVAPGAASSPMANPDAVPLSPMDTQTDVDGAQQTGVNDGMAWPWLISNLVFGGLAVLFMVAWLKAKRNKTQQNTCDEGQSAFNATLDDAFHAVRRACADNNPRAVRNALGKWARLYWQLPHAASLLDIISRTDSPALTRQLAELDKILYGNQRSGREADWRGEPLWRSLVRFKQKDKKKRQKQARASKDALPPLYPTTG